ncbi:Holliday junction resolvase RuvX [Candidatus Gracilibacteria bacterium]|nr:Holliday junction resolvase RuvX [Candidatus Gracilibacteria bacterium]
MNYLSIDLGDKRCGLAYSNMGFIFMLPFVNRSEIIPKLKKIILEKNISKIIVGLPYDLYNNDLKQLNKTKLFIKKLKEIFKNIEIDEIDERFTTFESLNILNGLSKNEIENKKDSMSAYLILESYLRQIKNSL